MYGASLKIWNIKDDLPTPCSLFSNRACCLFNIRCSVCAHYKKKNSARKGMFPLKIPLLCDTWVCIDGSTSLAGRRRRETALYNSLSAYTFVSCFVKLSRLKWSVAFDRSMHCQFSVSRFEAHSRVTKAFRFLRLMKSTSVFHFRVR